jgi:hypothetical protein
MVACFIGVATDGTSCLMAVWHLIVFEAELENVQEQWFMKNMKMITGCGLAAVAMVGLVLGLSAALRADEPAAPAAPAIPAIPAAGATVSGKVVDANAQGVASVKVILVKASDMPAKGKHKAKNGGEVPTTQPANGAAAGKHAGALANLPAVASATTDANGAFTFDSKVADGDYVVIGTAKSLGRDQQNVSVVNGVNPADVTLTLHKAKANGDKAGVKNK